MRKALRLINDAVETHRSSKAAGAMCRAISHAYATGLIEMAYAQGLITTAEFDACRADLESADQLEVACA